MSQGEELLLSIVAACPVSLGISVNLNYGFKLVKTLLGLKKMSTKGG